MSNVTRILYCSFCHESQNDVAHLIAGPSAFICDKCVDICASIVAEQKAKEEIQPELSAEKLKAGLMALAGCIGMNATRAVLDAMDEPK